MHKHYGFTIVELLIVIVIIAVLAAVTVVAYNGVQQRSKASGLASSFSQLEKSFRLYGTQQGWSTWPSEIDMGGANGATVETILSLPANTSLKSYLPRVPDAYGTTTNTWVYDNDGDTKTNCTNRAGGVNMNLVGVDQALATAMDVALDDGVISCGKVRYEPTNSTIYYAFTYDGSF